MSLIYTLVLWLASVEINTVATIIYHFDPKHLPLFSPDMIIAGIYQVVGYTAQLIFRLYLKFKKNLCNSTELLSMVIVVMLPIVYIVPLICIAIEDSVKVGWVVLLVGNITLLPAAVLTQHHGARNHFQMKHPLIYENVKKVVNLSHAIYNRVRNAAIDSINAIFQFYVNLCWSNQIQPYYNTNE